MPALPGEGAEELPPPEEDGAGPVLRGALDATAGEKGISKENFSFSGYQLTGVYTQMHIERVNNVNVREGASFTVYRISTDRGVHTHREG